MTKKKRTKKKGWKSLGANAKRLKIKLRKIEKLGEILPEEIRSDSKAVMEWLRRWRNKKKRIE